MSESLHVNPAWLTILNFRAAFYAITRNAPIQMDDDGKIISQKIGYAECGEGWIDTVQIEPWARHCGIAVVLTELCLIDPELGGKRPYNSNNLVQNLVGKIGNFAHYQDLLERAMRNVMGLKMTAEPLAGGFVFLSAAMRMGYHDMIIDFYRPPAAGPSGAPDWDEGDGEQCGPKFAFYKTHDVQARYDANTGRIAPKQNRLPPAVNQGGFDDYENSGPGSKWFLCLPRQRRPVGKGLYTLE